jgi:hypothetical protein
LSPVVAPGEKYYLRSVAHKTAAHLPASFPSLAADLQPGVLLPNNNNERSKRGGKKGGESGGSGRGTAGAAGAGPGPGPGAGAGNRGGDGHRGGDGAGEEGSKGGGGGGDDTNANDTLWPAGAYHSSVLRIASPGTALWTHYDTHDNLLAQVAGRKTVTLWPPGAESFLYVEGSSSRVDDIDPHPDPATSRRFPKFAAVSNRRRVATLGPGDALYIPALWFHHVLSHPASTAEDAAEDDASLNSGDGDVGGSGGGGGGGGGSGGGMSIAVNVFWKCLPAGEHDPGDLFGNKDPPAARRASDLAARAGAAIAHLPEPHRTFYARRAVQRLAVQLGMELGGL